MERPPTVDERSPRPIPWWGAVLLPILALVTLAMLLELTARVRAIGSSSAPVASVSADPWNLAAIQLAAFGLAIFAGLMLFARRVPLRQALAIQPTAYAAVFLAMIAGAALQFPLSEVANIVQEIWPQPLEQRLAQYRLVHPEGLVGALAVIAAIVVVAPLSEELLFRGLLLPGLAERYGPSFAIGVTAITFGLVHVQPWAVIPATLAGVLLGSVTYRTGSVLPALAMHASVNAVPVLLTDTVVSIRGFNTYSEQVQHMPLALVLGTTGVVAACMYFLSRLDWDGT